ncbi:MAG: ABC transporter permease [Coriobacteriia bacterium]|nr:ABC transporter permease [Coriobacteriia bacterium]
MKLGNLIIKNVLRQKTRTGLTLLGISIGIATILTLGAVADGLTVAFSGIVSSGEADFLIGQAGSSDLTFSRLNEDILDRLRDEDGIEQIEGVSLGVTRYGENPFFMAFGLSESGVKLGGFSRVRGDALYPGEDEVVLGKVAASVTGKEPGDTIELFGEEFEVVGVYETGEQLQDGGAMFRTSTLQRVTQTEGNITIAFAKVTEGTDVAEITAHLDEKYAKEIVTIKSADEVSRIDQGTEIINGATWMISALAVIIGAIGVMNTMIISVFDRIREIGVLKAVGWRRRTVMAMVLGESVIIGLVAVVVGSAIAMAVLVPMSQTDMARAFLQPAYSVELWLRATAVAVLVSVIGALYPAWKAASLSPVEALRYE